ncbi:MAG: hypothetical protein H0V63_08380 [Burkholderiaceae bacterium]|nr:hypothetical protein [Burkholderiaceae bacterium]
MRTDLYFAALLLLCVAASYYFGGIFTWLTLSLVVVGVVRAVYVLMFANKMR